MKRQRQVTAGRRLLLMEVGKGRPRGGDLMGGGGGGGGKGWWWREVSICIHAQSKEFPLRVSSITAIFTGLCARVLKR